MHLPSDQAIGRALEAGDRTFRELADFAPVMIWRSGLDKSCDWFNKPWLDFVGRTMAEEIGYGWAEGVHVDDYDRCVAVYGTAFDRREPFSIEYRLRRHDGEYRWVLDNGAPYFRDGEFAGYFGSCIDITEHKRLEEHQQLLIDELNHRVKNTLAVVQSIARQSFAPDKEANALLRSYEGRIQAMARAHSLLAAEKWEPVSLENLVREATAACCPEAQVSIAGPDVRLAPHAAVYFGMGLHELATNAVKYGACSDDAGQVRIEWQIAGTDTPVLHFTWLETGGPVVSPPARQGFGTIMLERALAWELKAQVHLEFQSTGALFRMEAELAALQASAGSSTVAG